MGLRTLDFVYFYSVGINFSRQNLMTKDDPSTVRVEINRNITKFDKVHVGRCIA